MWPMGALFKMESVSEVRNGVSGGMMAHRICLKFIFKVHTEDIMNQMRRQFLKNGYIWMTHDTPMTQWISNTINALLGVMLPSEAAFSRGNGRTLVVCYGCQHRGVFPLLTATAFKLCAQCSGMEKRLNNKVTNSFIIHTLLPVRANKHTKIPPSHWCMNMCACVCVCSLALPSMWWWGWSWALA